MKFKLLVVAALWLLAALPATIDLEQKGLAGAKLRVRMRSNVASQVQVYYDLGAGLNEGQSSTLPIFRTAVPVVLDFRLPAGQTITGLRFDPLQTAGEVVIQQVTALDAGDRVWREIPLASFTPLNQIASTARLADGLHVVTAPDGTDPNLNISLATPLRLPVRGVWAGVPGLLVRHLLRGIVLGTVIVAVWRIVGWAQHPAQQERLAAYAAGLREAPAWHWLMPVTGWVAGVFAVYRIAKML